jgi:membrane-associated protein
MPHIIDLFLHLDKHLGELVSSYGTLSYLILFLIVFCETGLVVTPFLPGDSLLFAAGALASTGSFDLPTLFAVLIIAAILGDLVNYQIGKFIGPKAFDAKYQRFFKKEYLLQTQAFFEKHGGKAIIIARFVPIIRTFAPFLAGVGSMPYKQFGLYNIAGALIWVLSICTAGYLFGEIPVVKNNFSLVVIGIIIVSIMPAVIEFIRAKRAQTTA